MHVYPRLEKWLQLVGICTYVSSVWPFHAHVTVDSDKSCCVPRQVNIWHLIGMAVTWNVNWPAQPPSWPSILNLYCLWATWRWWSIAAQTRSKHISTSVVSNASNLSRHWRHYLELEHVTVVRWNCPTSTANTEVLRTCEATCQASKVLKALF